MSKDLEQLEHVLRTRGNDLDRLATEREARLQATKGRFNLFTILRQPHEETGLHSQYLAHLLGPRASHDCGSLFLRLFLEQVGNGAQTHHDEGISGSCDLLASLDPASLKAAVVYTEMVAPEVGRLDIVVELGSWGVIVIENKIYAAEQKEQIDRYVGYLEAKYKGRRYLMLYLTLDGRESSTAKKHAERYLRISYKKHILDWLEKCLRATYQYVNINQTLQQYKMVVQHLTGTLPEDQMEQVRGVVRQTPSLIRHSRAICEAVETIRQETMSSFVEYLRGRLAAAGIQAGEWRADRSNTLKWTKLTSADELPWTKAGISLTFEYGQAQAYVGLAKGKDGNTTQISTQVASVLPAFHTRIEQHYPELKTFSNSCWWGVLVLPRRHL